MFWFLAQINDTNDHNIVAIYPHNPDYFTEGLYYESWSIYESSWINGKSKIVKYGLKSGQIELEQKIDDIYFGEWLAIIWDKIYLLTWQSNEVLIFDKKTFKIIDKKAYTWEWWWLTSDWEFLIMSDWSSNIYFRDPETFSIIKTIKVATNKINELEYINWNIVANVFTTDKIIIIDAENWNIRNVINLGDLNPRKVVWQKILNGIAYVKESWTLLITWKNWPWTYEIKLRDKL